MNLNATHLMQGLGLAGEEHVSHDNTVWVTKTHWPFPIGMEEPEYDADKIFVITRNPVDVIPSVFLLFNTGSHSMISKENIPEVFPNEWD